MQGLGAFLSRHLCRLIDVWLVLAATFATVWAGCTYNIFPDSPGYEYAPDILEPDEILLALIVFVGGLVIVLARADRPDASRSSREPAVSAG